MRFLRFILTFALFSFALTGDYVVFKSKYSDSVMFRAATDSLVHGIIGLLSAAVFFSHKVNVSLHVCFVNTLLCAAISSLIDIDHVIVAKSFQLKDLTSLTERGIFHCTTFWIIISIVSLLFSYAVKKFNMYLLSFMIIIAFSSHHIRDGNRRGLWIYPYGHTKSINKYLYTFSIAVLPNVFAYVFIYFKTHFSENVIEYMSIIYLVFTSYNLVSRMRIASGIWIYIRHKDQ